MLKKEFETLSFLINLNNAIDRSIFGKRVNSFTSLFRNLFFGFRRYTSEESSVKLYRRICIVLYGKLGGLWEPSEPSRITFKLASGSPIDILLEAIRIVNQYDITLPGKIHNKLLHATSRILRFSILCSILLALLLIQLS